MSEFFLNGTPLDPDTLKRWARSIQFQESGEAAAASAPAACAAVNSPAAASPPTHFAFLIQRPIDTQPWATIFSRQDLAESYPGRISDVVPIRLVPHEKSG